LNFRLKSVANFKPSNRGDEFLRNGVINAGLDVKPIRAHARLTGVAVFGYNRPFNCSIEIGVVENNKGRVAAEFQGKLLDRGGTLLHEQASDFRGTRKGNFGYIGIGGQFPPNLLGTTGQNVEDSCRNPSAFRQHSKRQGRKGCRCGGSRNHGASRS
jgi:hypothetical protein